GRPPAALFAKLIDDRVLGFQRRELRMRHLRVAYRAVDGQRAIGAQVRAPVDTAYARVQRLGRFDREARERQQHTVRDARPETQLVRLLECRRALDAGAHLVQLGRTG